MTDKTEPRPRPAKAADPEILALSRAFRLLDALDERMRVRVVQLLAAKYAPEAAAKGGCRAVGLSDRATLTREGPVG